MKGEVCKEGRNHKFRSGAGFRIFTPPAAKRREGRKMVKQNAITEEDRGGRERDH